MAHTQKRSLLLPLVLVLTAAAILLKAWPLIIDPRLWAEDATQHFSAAQRQGLLSLFLPQQGYLSILANLTAWVGVQLPLRYWPYAPLIVSFLIQLLPLILIGCTRGAPLDAPLKKSGFMLIYIALMFDASYQETWLNVVNSQFYLCIATILVLMATEIRPHLLARTTLLLAGVSGIVSAVLAPVFCLKAYRTKEREHTIHAAIISATLLVQIIYVVYCRLSGDYSPFRESGFSANSMVAFYFLRTLAENFLSPQALKGFDVASASWVALLAYALCVVLFFSCILRVRRSTIRYLFLAYLLLSIVTYIGSLGDKSGFFEMNTAGRYFLPLSALVIFMLANALEGAGYQRTRVLLLALLLMFFMNSAGSALVRDARFFNGPSWEREVETLASKRYGVLSVWPDRKLFYCSPTVCNIDNHRNLMNDAQLVQDKAHPAKERRLRKHYLYATGKGVQLRLPEIRSETPAMTLLQVDFKMPDKAKTPKVRVEYLADGKKRSWERAFAARDIMLLTFPPAKRISQLRLFLLGGKGEYRLADITSYSLRSRAEKSDTKNAAGAKQK